MFQDYLYSEKTVPDVLERYINELLETGDINDNIHANKLRFYLSTIQDRRYLASLRSFFNKTYDLIDKKHPNLHFSIDGRRKALISYEKKIRHYLFNKRPLDDIRDIFAFRIILFGDEDVLNLEEHCYLIMADIIKYALSQGFTPCAKSVLMDVSDIQDRTIPKYIADFEFRDYVKDYIIFQKDNGYQSLHLVLTDPKGRYLEIQIRTLKMHCVSEAGNAEHSQYKRDKYLDLLIDRERIAVHGYSYFGEQVFDFAGVEEGLTVFKRQKTF